MLNRALLGMAAILIAVTFASPLAEAKGAHAAFAKTCGRSTMIIRYMPGASNGDRNELVIREGTKSPVILPPPKGLEKYDPVGLACAHTPEKASYFVVEYGDASHTCASCEWHHVYATDGRILTQSDPAFVSDPTLPGGQSSHPNNADFIRVSKQWRLSDPSMEYGH